MKESKTTYSYLIEHMQNPSFQKVWDIAYDFVRKLSSDLCNELHESLNRGLDVLDSEPLLQMYIYSFGKMHNAKLQYAFEHLQENVVKCKEIEIVDYGCGQGLATICYHDFLLEHNSNQTVKKITLIEPSSLALSRAELLCSRFFPDAEIVAINKQFDELTKTDLIFSSKRLTLHLLSNILDVESYDLSHFSQIVKEQSVGNNEYVIVSPMQNNQRTQRLKTFASTIDKTIYFEQYLDKRQLDEDKDWTCAALICSNLIKQVLIELDYDILKEETKQLLDNEKENLDNEHCKELFQKIQICANQGDKRFQYLLGIWHEKGIGTDQNSQLALELYKLSAEQEYAPAFAKIGDLFCEGYGVEQDSRKAVEYYLLGADKNQAACQLGLGRCYFKGIGVERDYNEAVRWLSKAAEQEEETAIYNLGICYSDGLGVEKDLENAYSLFLKSASLGFSYAKYQLFRCYLDGLGTPKDEKMAIRMLKEAIKLKHPKSCYIMAKFCQLGKHVKKDERKALRMFKKAAELEYGPAQEVLGNVYRKGLLGEEESPKRSFKWYYKAAEQGYVSAQFYVGYYYASGYGVMKDAKLAFEWYLNAAEQNSPAALNNLAFCYEYGKGTEIDLEKAAHYYEESAKLGNITAQKNLAICYKNGTGVKPDSNKVFYWTLKAAKIGDVDSMGRIASYCLKGFGTDRNKAEALLWYARYYSKNIHIGNASEAFSFFKENSEEGDSQALYVVGKCFQYGVATEKNLENAFMYFEKAAKLGHIESLIKTHQSSSLYEFCSIKENKKVYKDAYGVKYSEDKKILIDGGYQKGDEYRIARGTRIICDNAFDTGDVGNIIIPSSVVAIGKSPFAGSSWGRCAIKNIECYSAQFVVSDFALFTRDKKKLISYFGNASEVTIPEGVEIIGSKAFLENEDLKEINFPESLCAIEDAAFKYCLNLRRVLLPKNVRILGVQCFYGCESLEDIAFCGELDKICKESFMGCNIRELSLPESLVEIDENAFNSNNHLEAISLPAKVRKVGNSSFAFCSIKRVNLNDGLQEIGDLCFFDCPIESIVIPSSVKSVGLNPFIGAIAVESKENCLFVAENGLLYNKQNGGLISHYGETEVALYPPIKHVNSFAFYNSNVTDIFMGSNIDEVSSWSFYNAHKLERVIWRKSRVAEIPMGCFGDCSKISKIDIPSCVENVQKGAFFDCYDLRIIRFDSMLAKANEEIFSRVERPSCIPFSYSPRHHLTGSTICEYIERDVDPNTFSIIEVIVPQGYSRNFSFSPIYDHDICNTHKYYGYGMDRRFIIKEDGKE